MLFFDRIITSLTEVDGIFIKIATSLVVVCANIFFIGLSKIERKYLLGLLKKKFF